jgi:hypothetical protein
MGDVAALLGGADELLDRRIGEVEQWAVRQGLGKPVLNNTDRLLFVWLCRLVPTTLTALAVVSPETVIRWQRAGLRALYVPETQTRR